MKKSKVAISLGSELLNLIDSMVDGTIIRSRSQAIEYYLKKGLNEQSVNTAVLLLKGGHQNLALKDFNGIALIRQQIKFFAKYGIKNVIVVTQHTKEINLLLNELSNSELGFDIFESDSKGNASALKSAIGKIKGNFVVMSGDTYNDFDLLKMMKKHIQSDKIVTMGLMTRSETSSYGAAILDGDLIVDFQEKPKSQSGPNPSTTIVNAGIYIFKPEIHEFLKDANSLEKDVFPKLARMKQLIGFFTYGEYKHIQK